MDAEATVREYYAALDEDRYDDLRAVLAPGFTQHRPNRTFEDRASFIAFVRDDRPHSDTTHDLDGVYTRTPDDASDASDPSIDPKRDAADSTLDPDTDSDGYALASGERETVLARGVVKQADDTTLVRFVDCFDIIADRIVALETYTR